MPRQPIHSVYFTKLVLANIRSFSERQELNFVDADNRPARWTLIVGDNGVGKTTLLQCLARMRPVFHKPSDENTGPIPNPVEPELAGEEDNDELDALARSGGSTEARLEAELSFGVPLAGRKARRRGIISTWLSITRSKGRFTGFDRGGESPDNVQEPLVLAYGAGRHPKTTDFDKVIATGPVESLFTVESALHDAEDLLYRLEFGSLREDRTARQRLVSLKRMLAEVLPDVGDPHDIEILGPPVSTSSRDSNGVRVKTPYGNVPLSRLSLGYQTVFAWTLDIAWRLIDRYPNSPEPLQQPAVVIVDEIDLHLHPRWQRDIRDHLTGHFPGVQFIATAHSPLMAQSSLGANLAVLRNSEDHAEILNDPTIIRGWRLDQIITSDLFEFGSARPREFERLLNRRRVLAEKGKLSNAEKRELQELDEQASKIPTSESPADHDAMQIIRRAAAALKKNGEES